MTDYSTAKVFTDERAGRKWPSENVEERLFHQVKLERERGREGEEGQRRRRRRQMERDEEGGGGEN